MSENALELRQTSIPNSHELKVYELMAKHAVGSNRYRALGGQEGIMMTLFAAHDLGIPATQALNGGLHLIQGKVELSAMMMGALIRRRKHQIKIVKSTDEECVLEGKRADTGEVQQASFTLVDAERAGLVKKGGGWDKFPKDMCYARALSRLARQLFTDVIGIGYVQGEISNPTASLEDQEFEEVEVKKSIEELQELVISQISVEEREIFNLYFKELQKSYGWTQEQCLEKLAQSQNLTVNFDAWKAKKQLP